MAPLSSTEIQVPKASPPTLSQARDLRLRQELLLRRELSLKKDGGPTKPKAPPPPLSAGEKEHLRREFGNGKLGAESTSRSHDANQGQQGQVPAVPKQPPTTAPTGPSTAEAGTASTRPTTKVDEVGHRRSYYDGYGVALCRLPTTNGIHILTTWLCAEVVSDVDQMQLKHVVLGRISALIIPRCTPLAPNLCPHVVPDDTGAAYNVDRMYNLPMKGLLEYFATDHDTSVELFGSQNQARSFQIRPLILLHNFRTNAPTPLSTTIRPLLGAMSAICS